MALTHEDIQELKKVLDDRYVLLTTCNDVQTSVSRKLSNDDKRIELISHDFSVIKKLMWVIASGTIGSLVAAFIELILK